MSEDQHDEATPDSVSDADETSHPIQRNMRVIGIAAACLLVFALTTYLTKAMSAGATIIVEADEVATILMKTGGLRLKEVDGPLVLKLHPGRNAVRAGKFKVVGQIEGQRLEISTGRTLEIEKDGELMMKIQTVSLEEEP